MALAAVPSMLLQRTVRLADMSLRMLFVSMSVHTDLEGLASEHTKIENVLASTLVCDSPDPISRQKFGRYDIRFDRGRKH